MKYGGSFQQHHFRRYERPDGTINVASVDLDQLLVNKPFTNAHCVLREVNALSNIHAALISVNHASTYTVNDNNNFINV
jgi:hypothetical protein